MKKALIALILALSLSTLPLLLARASPGDSPFDNLWVWPVGATETGDPIATLSPAYMFIRTKAAVHPAYDVWILLAVNQETYDKLEKIEITNESIDISVTYLASEFHDGLTEPSARIPALEADGEPDQPGYPGCEFDDQYSIGAIKEKLGTTGPVYYCIKYVFDYVDTTEIFFTITVYLTEPEPNLKVLVLANGACVDDGILDQCTAYSKAALIVIPELATILLATASLTAFGVYTLKHRKK